jgi:tRNA A-37 threonylcarbamoyl transferase component Bud32
MTELTNIFTKKNVSFKEYQIHQYVYGLTESYDIHVPKPLHYNHETREFTMELIPNMCISDFYGESHKNVPHKIFKQIQKIITILNTNNVYYPDITGYNFIEFNGNVWIIDFGHASIEEKFNDSFVNDFMNGLCEWNPNFL